MIVSEDKVYFLCALQLNQWNEVLIHFGLLLIVWNISNIQSFSVTLLLFQLFSQKDASPLSARQMSQMSQHMQ